jgi:hypothetical protein
LGPAVAGGEDYPVRIKKITERLPDIGVVGAKRLLADGHRALVQRIGLCIAPLITVDLGEFVECLGNAKVLGSKHLFVNLERLFVQRRGLGVAVLGLV